MYYRVVTGGTIKGYHLPVEEMLLRGARPTEAGVYVPEPAAEMVLFVIRTVGNPLRSRPSWPLALTTLLIVALAIALPFTTLGVLLGFVPLPAAYFAFLAGASATYLLLVEFAKRPLMRRRWAAD